jgi:lysophospholipase L1-like esterase
VVGGAGVLVIMLIAGELIARLYFGLGDPPLLRADPELEYVFLPDQHCHRFGNVIRYNHYSMRSDDFPQHKSQPGELRVMLIGDSIINGGAQTDQSQLATQLLQQALTAKLKRPVVVGNISAGSWGPPNELAYLKRYGLFDADVLVIVLNSPDYADVPTFVPVVGVDPSFPAHKPVLALFEGIQRYLLPRLKGVIASNEGSAPTTAPVSQSDIDQSMSALREMIAMGRQQGAAVIVAQHLWDAESPNATQPGHDVITAEAQRDGAELVQLGPAFAEAKQRGEQPYRDGLHPNPLGQRLIFDTLLPKIEGALMHPPATRPAATSADCIDSCGRALSSRLMQVAGMMVATPSGW